MGDEVVYLVYWRVGSLNSDAGPFCFEEAQGIALTLKTIFPNAQTAIRVKRNDVPVVFESFIETMNTDWS